jgi:hypothetical protein
VRASRADPAWELSRSMAVSDRLVLLVRALAVFALYAALGLAASAASGTAATVTFGWLVPMTAVCALALAVATVTRSANVGMAVGLGGWGDLTRRFGRTAAVAGISLEAGPGVFGRVHRAGHLVTYRI